MSSDLLKTPQVRILSEVKKVIRAAPSPSGLGAAIIGPAHKGPAFIPRRIATQDVLTASFGHPLSKDSALLAAYYWLENSDSCTFLRVLGSGDCKKRKSDGSVNNAGFVVGDQLPQDSSANFLGKNPFAVDGGPLGRTYFLGCFMTASNISQAGVKDRHSNIFSDAGINPFVTDPSKAKKAVPILRGVIMVPSGVVLSLKSPSLNNDGDATNVENYKPYVDGSGNPRPATGNFGQNTATDLAGYPIGSVENINSGDNFRILLNGFRSSPNFLDVSFDPQREDYFAKKLNSDPKRIEEKGHCLYTYYDVYNSFASITDHADVAGAVDGTQAAFLLTSSLDRDKSSGSTAGFTGVPNFENFRDRYSHASSPWVVSQTLYGKVHNLFKIHAVDDGKLRAPIKIRISNITPLEINKDGLPEYDYSGFGSFDLTVHTLDGNLLDEFRGINLNPQSESYIARIIGDVDMRFDFDSSKKVVISGRYRPNVVEHIIRVEMSPDVDRGKINKSLLPFGFRGAPHLITSGSRSDSSAGIFQTVDLSATSLTADHFKNIVEPPIPMRLNIRSLVPFGEILPWGFQATAQTTLSSPNSKADVSKAFLSGSFLNFFPNFDTVGESAWSVDRYNYSDLNSGTVVDNDRFNNNFFSLEKVEFLTKRIVTFDNKTIDIPDVNNGLWQHANYCRNGVSRDAPIPADVDNPNNAKFQFLKITDLIHGNLNNYCSFEFPLFGGFNGTDIFSKNKSELNDYAIVGEVFDPNQGGLLSGPTVSSYNASIDILKNEPQFDAQFIAIPGIGHRSVTDNALDFAEERKNLLYIMDVERYASGSILISSDQQNAEISIDSTVDRHLSRMIDSSYAAAYFPEVLISPPNKVASDVRLPAVANPASIAALATFSRNDLDNGFFTPNSGQNRGKVFFSSPDNNVGLELTALSQVDISRLLSARINTFSVASGGGNFINSQMTLIKDNTGNSVLRMIHVRRTLIDTRRRVEELSKNFLFDQATAAVAEFYKFFLEALGTDLLKLGSLKFYEAIVESRTPAAKENFAKGIIRATVRVRPNNSKEIFTVDATVDSEETRS